MKRTDKDASEEGEDDEECGREGVGSRSSEERRVDVSCVERLLNQMREMCYCPICFDFYHAPVMFPKCGHTFCSLCIRQALLFKDECPSCRIEARTNDLVPVRIVEGMSTLCQKITHRIEDERGLSAHADRLDSIHSVEPMEQEHEFPPPPKRRRRNEPAQNSPNNPGNDDYRDIQVECPNCKINVRPENMEKHRAACPGTEEGREELVRAAEATKAVAKPHVAGNDYPKKRLPLLAYSVLNDKVLRKKCEEYKLPSRGSRALREKRLKEYINRYNAECDSDNPKTVQEIIDDVLSAENEYKQATKPKKVEKKKQSKLTFKKLFDVVKSQKKPDRQQQKQQQPSRSEVYPEEYDSQQTQLSNCIRDPWDFTSQNQLDFNEDEGEGEEGERNDWKYENNFGNVDEANKLDETDEIVDPYELEIDNRDDNFYTQLN